MLIFIHGEIEKKSNHLPNQRATGFIDIGLSSNCCNDLNDIVKSNEKIKIIVLSPHFIFADLIKHSDKISELCDSFTLQIGNIVKFYREHHENIELSIIGKDGYEDNIISKENTNKISKIIDAIEPSFCLAAHHIIETNSELKKAVNYLYACSNNQLSNTRLSFEGLIKDIKSNLNDRPSNENLEKDLSYYKQENKCILDALFSLQEKAEVSFKRNYVDNRNIKEKDSTIKKLHSSINNYKEMQVEDENLRSWLLLTILKSRGALWSKSLKFRRSLSKEALEIEGSGIFDENFYLENNEDLKNTKLKPSLHYLLFGQFEGRNPSEVFHTLNYIRKYPDVAQFSSSPLIHFLKHGQKENRIPNIKKPRLLK